MHLSPSHMHDDKDEHPCTSRLHSFKVADKLSFKDRITFTAFPSTLQKAVEINIRVKEFCMLKQQLSITSASAKEVVILGIRLFVTNFTQRLWWNYRLHLVKILPDIYLLTRKNWLNFGGKTDWMFLKKFYHRYIFGQGSPHKILKVIRILTPDPRIWTISALVEIRCLHVLIYNCVHRF